MHPFDIARTSAFRLTLLFSLLLISSMILLFGLIYWQSAVFLTSQMDLTIRHETDEFLAAPQANKPRNIDRLVASDSLGDWYAGLFDANHRRLAGNLVDWPQDAPFDGKIHTIVKGLPSAHGPTRHEMRALTLRLTDGNVVVVAHRANDVHQVKEAILESAGAGLAVSVALAILGGLVMSFASLRRLEAMHRTTKAIINGDLSQRLAVRGNGDDFDKLALIVNSMLANIERLIGDIKAAGDNIAHDLRTPLTRLRTRLDGALRRGGDVAAHRAAMEDAIIETDKILATFRALLRISEVEAGQRRAGFGAVDLHKLVTSAAELFEPIAADRGLVFDYQLDANPVVHGDPDLLFEAVANLLDNAIKFTPSGGAISISLSQTGEITVQDTGPGLPDEIGKAMFQRFTRGDKARHFPGNGLGLSLVAAVVGLHGFTLEVENLAPGCLMRITPKQA